MLRVIALALAVLAAGCVSNGPNRSANVLPSTEPVPTASVPVAVSKRAYSALVIDARNGKVLHETAATSYRYPASLTKMMTLYMMFESMNAGRISSTTRFTVSEEAASRPPAKLGVKAGTTISVDQAARALAVRSANDVAVVVAENMAGSEEAFAARMTQRARQLGMTRTNFANASGLPDENQYTTARDMAILGRILMEKFPNQARYFQVQEFTYNGRTWRNTNKLLKTERGMEGIKTGYIRDSGYNLVVSVRRDGRHVVAVVIGGKSGRARNAKMKALLDEYIPKASRGGVMGLRLF